MRQGVEALSTVYLTDVRLLHSKKCSIVSIWEKKRTSIIES